ncbi:uncharacterized protein A1O5_07008 [Cladophialophora psammophila CBS 110553]|uniref:Aquaglyceroporin like protein, other eukaryote n=1 Tax=Cladophialophora psammophila CBS 110553 TaxID=1182543 RepID=W9WY15_9EURO|nr:uncharacterized protein A1O5_07008 [Cladophialophora psammophila CBS 110553]EXJ69935.1 hypothetical protein A1O5_07008 [Cladophialophora psammophila CBS 110553]
MRSRATRQDGESTGEPTATTTGRHSREPAHHQTSTGTQPAPRIEVSPARHREQEHDHPSRASAGTRSSAREPDLLRRATTANASSYLSEPIVPHNTLQQPGILGTETRQRERQLAVENISAHDKAPTSSAEGQRRSEETHGTDIRRYISPSGSTAHDSLVAGHDLERGVSGESAVELARRRLQQLADTAGDESDVRRYPPNIDWEEYHPSGDTLVHRFSQPEEPSQPEFHNAWGPIRHKYRKPLAEFLGTLVFMTLGLSGSIVHMTAGSDYGSLLTAYMAWGFGVMIGIYIAGGISGAHLNPTISLVLAIFRGFPWTDCWKYMVAQFLGSMAASAIVYGLYNDAIQAYTASDTVRIGPAFWTQPRGDLNNAAAFFNEFIATAIAACSVLALGDDDNAPPGAGMHAFIISLLVMVLGMAFSYNTGAALNPARDFGPRLIMMAAGLGFDVFKQDQGWWFWGPWIGTMTGGLAGASVYDFFIFTGAESPINYDSDVWKLRLKSSWKEIRQRSRIGRGKDPGGDVSKEIDLVA